jgi:hypothetical protein
VANPNHLYAGTVVLTSSRTVVKSLDGGQTWVSAFPPGFTTSKRGGLPLVEVNKLLADPRDTAARGDLRPRRPGRWDGSSGIGTRSIQRQRRLKAPLIHKNQNLAR